MYTRVVSAARARRDVREYHHQALPFLPFLPLCVTECTESASSQGSSADRLTQYSMRNDRSRSLVERELKPKGRYRRETNVDPFVGLRSASGSRFLARARARDRAFARRRTSTKLRAPIRTIGRIRRACQGRTLQHQETSRRTREEGSCSGAEDRSGSRPRITPITETDAAVPDLDRSRRIQTRFNV